MITENGIVNALAQCRIDPTEIGNALYALYNDQSHYESMRMVFRRLNYN
jgi:hypothetical protein